jgi:hypothetical protein
MFYNLYVAKGKSIVLISVLAIIYFIGNYSFLFDPQNQIPDYTGCGRNSRLFVIFYVCSRFYLLMRYYTKIGMRARIK